MPNPSTPILDRATTSGCGCFAEVPPMPMGCATCGHAPYAHGCPDRPADHEYVQPSGDLMNIRLRVRRTGDRSLPCFEPAPAAPAAVIPDQRSAEKIPPIPEQRRPDRSTAAERLVPVSSLQRRLCRPRPASPSGAALTGPPRLGGGRRPVSRSGLRTTCAPNRSAVTPSSCRSPGRYGEPLHFMRQARPTLETTGRALDRIEVQSVTDGVPPPQSPPAPRRFPTGG